MLNFSAQLDRSFHALADPSRRAIVERLVRGSATVTELARPLAMSLPAVMQHLRVLEQSGLVRSEKTGRTRHCRIDREAIGRLERWIADQRAEWTQRLDRLDAYLNETISSGDDDERR